MGTVLHCSPRAGETPEKGFWVLGLDWYCCWCLLGFTSLVDLLHTTTMGFREVRLFVSYPSWNDTQTWTPNIVPIQRRNEAVKCQSSSENGRCTTFSSSADGEKRTRGTVRGGSSVLPDKIVVYRGVTNGDRNRTLLYGTNLPGTNLTETETESEVQWGREKRDVRSVRPPWGKGRVCVTDTNQTGGDARGVCGSRKARKTRGEVIEEDVHPTGRVDSLNVGRLRDSGEPSIQGSTSVGGVNIQELRTGGGST